MEIIIVSIQVLVRKATALTAIEQCAMLLAAQIDSTMHRARQLWEEVEAALATPTEVNSNTQPAQIFYFTKPQNA